MQMIDFTHYFTYVYNILIFSILFYASNNI